MTLKAWLIVLVVAPLLAIGYAIGWVIDLTWSDE